MRYCEGCAWGDLACRLSDWCSDRWGVGDDGVLWSYCNPSWCKIAAFAFFLLFFLLYSKILKQPSLGIVSYGSNHGRELEAQIVRFTPTAAKDDDRRPPIAKSARLEVHGSIHRVVGGCFFFFTIQYFREVLYGVLSFAVVHKHCFVSLFGDLIFPDVGLTIHVFYLIYRKLCEAHTTSP